jgi:CRP/FNR family transcriptional regulator
MANPVIQNHNCATCKHYGYAFCALDEDQVSLFNDSKKESVLKKGSVIFTENHFPTGIYALYDGKVKISKLGDEGKEQIVRFAKSGDFIGYRSLLSEDSYHASAVALNDVTLCHIPKTKFLSVLKENFWLQQDLIKRLAIDLRNAENRILSISQKTVKERIAETLIILYYEFGHKENESIDVKLSRKDIGNIAGSTIETTIRTLSELKKEGFIEFNGKEIIVKDITALEHIANIH